MYSRKCYKHSCCLIDQRFGDLLFAFLHDTVVIYQKKFVVVVCIVTTIPSHAGQNAEKCKQWAEMYQNYCRQLLNKIKFNIFLTQEDATCQCQMGWWLFPEMFPKIGLLHFKISKSLLRLSKHFINKTTRMGTNLGNATRSIFIGSNSLINVDVFEL